MAGPEDSPTRVTADHLHRAADVVGRTQDPSELGFKDGAIERFIAETDWRPEGGGSELALDSLAMAMGISIGLVAARESAIRRITADEASADVLWRDPTIKAVVLEPDEDEKGNA